MSEADEDGPQIDALSLQRPVYVADVPLSALIGLGVIVIGIVLVLAALDRAQQLLGLAGLAAILAAILGPASRAAGRFLGVVTATVLIHLVVLLGVAAASGLVIQNIQREADALEAYADAEIDELEEGGGPVWLGRVDLSRRVGEGAATWGTVAVIGEDEAAGIATRLSQLVIIVVLSIFLSLQSDRLLDIVMGWTDDRDKRRVLREVWRHSVSAASSYLRRTIFVAVVSGCLAAGLAAAFGLPGLLLLGVWCGVLSMIPLLGPTVGWAPVAVLAAVQLSTGQAVAVAAIALIGVIVIHVARHRLLGLVEDAPRPGALLVALGIAAGLSAAGLPGAAAGIFLAVAFASAMSYDWSDIGPLESLGVASIEHEVDQAGDERRAHETTAEPITLDASNRLLLRPSRQTTLRVTALVVVAFMVQLSVTRMGPTLVWAVVGLLVAIGLDRPVSWLSSRTDVGRSAVVISCAVAVACLLAILVATTRDSLDNIAGFDDDIPALVESLENLPLVGDRLAETDLTSRIEDFEREIPRFLNRSPMAGQAAGVIGGGLVGVFWVSVIALAGLLDGPRIVSAIDKRVPARFRRQTDRLGRAAQQALAGYVAGSALVAAINGALIGTIGLAIGAPIPAILALWAFGWNFIPQVGAIIGWTPLLLLAVTGGAATGAAVFVFFVLYQAVENNLIQPTVVGHAVHITALAAFGAALVGAAVAGLIGAVLAIPIVGVVWSLRTEWQSDDFPSIRSGTT